MIPKIIHYCWFGRNPKPKLAKKCIKSWKKYCPGYEIIEWNEDNFDIFAAPLYVRQAYEAKKWAFVTDYVRLWAMVKFGGVYMDTDVEVIKPLDPFLQHKAFSGFENDTQIQTGIMACEKGFPLFEEFLHFYDNASFIHLDGSINETTNVVIMTDICLRHGLQQNGTYQLVEGLALYPKAYFCPIEYSSGKLVKTNNTTTIHWFSGSWHSTQQRKHRNSQKRRIARISRRHFILHLPNYIVKKLLGETKYEKLKSKLKRK